MARALRRGIRIAWYPAGQSGVCEASYVGAEDSRAKSDSSKGLITRAGEDIDS